MFILGYEMRYFFHLLKKSSENIVIYATSCVLGLFLSLDVLLSHERSEFDNTHRVTKTSKFATCCIQRFVQRRCEISLIHALFTKNTPKSLEFYLTKFIASGYSMHLK